MGLITKAVIIFFTIVFLILIVAGNPTPWIIGVTVIGGSILIAWQTVVILKDQDGDPFEDPDPNTNSYLKK